MDATTSLRLYAVEGDGSTIYIEATGIEDAIDIWRVTLGRVDDPRSCALLSHRGVFRRRPPIPEGGQ